MQALSFHTDRDISASGILEMMRQVVPVSAITWVENLWDIDVVDEHQLYVVKRLGAGQFSMYYEVQAFHRVENLVLRWRVDRLKTLARTEQCNILLADEGVDPYLFIHIHPAGDAVSVGVVTEDYNERDELTIDGYYNLAFGSFALEEPIEEKDIEVLTDLLRMHVPVFELRYAEGAVTFFNQFKDQFERLRKFVHHYFVMPSGKQEWFSRDEKAERFSSVMTVFGKDRKVCFFPANGSVTENIPGGSDSEAFCICLDGEEPAKVIYKPRRKSWLSN